MTTTVDLGYGRGRLLPDAAASVFRMDAQRKKPCNITSAIRTRPQQEALQRRWLAGGKYNRPPYLYQPDFTPPYEHEKGTVADFTDIAWMITFGRAHGWRRPFSYDKVHFEYFVHLDTKRPNALPTPGGVVLTPDPEDDDPMNDLLMFSTDPATKVTHYAHAKPGTGFFQELANPAEYNLLASALGTLTSARKPLAGMNGISYTTYLAYKQRAAEAASRGL